MEKLVGGHLPFRRFIPRSSGAFAGGFGSRQIARKTAQSNVAIRACCARRPHVRDERSAMDLPQVVPVAGQVTKKVVAAPKFEPFARWLRHELRERACCAVSFKFDVLVHVERVVMEMQME